jgi:hypothetical protein
VDANASINASFIISGFYIISGCYTALVKTLSAVEASFIPLEQLCTSVVLEAAM